MSIGRLRFLKDWIQILFNIINQGEKNLFDVNVKFWFNTILNILSDLE